MATKTSQTPSQHPEEQEAAPRRRRSSRSSQASQISLPDAAPSPDTEPSENPVLATVEGESAPKTPAKRKSAGRRRKSSEDAAATDQAAGEGSGAADAATDAEAPKKPRTRRTTKTTASKAKTEQDAQAQVDETSGEDAASAAPKKRRTSSTRTSRSRAAKASAEADVDQSVAREGQGEVFAETETAASEKAAPKRTRRKTKQAQDSAELERDETVLAEQHEEPAPRRRRRLVAAQATPQPAPPAEELLAQTFAAQASDETPHSDAHDEEAKDLTADAASNTDTSADMSAEASEEEVPEVPGQTEETAQESKEGAAEGQAEEPGDEQPFLPAASLLFQAPDASRARRRRRVVAPQTAPLTLPTEEELEEAATRSRRGTTAKQAPAHKSEEVQAAPTQAPTRRRRRVVAAQATPEHVEEIPAEQVAQELAALAAKKSADVDATPEGIETTAEAEASSEASESSEGENGGRRKRRRGGRGRRARSGRGEQETQETANPGDADDSADQASAASAQSADAAHEDDPDSETTLVDGEEAGVSTSRRRRRRRSRSRSDMGRDVRDEVTALKGSTRLEAKRQRRREGRAAGRRRPIVTEAEFLARRESVDRQMIVREQDGLNQIAVLEDGVLVEHYVARHTQSSMVGNVYVGRVQNVLPSMEAAFVDIGKGRNAVLYAGEVNWDMAGMEGKPRRIEDALKSGDTVLVQVTKDPIGHKGARLTSQITLAGRYLVLVPGGSMTGISRKLPDTERTRLKGILRRIVPDDAGVIVRTAAEGASEEQLVADVERLRAQWESIDKKASQILRGSGKAPVLLKGEPELAVRVVRDVFNEDFRKLIVQGPDAWATISEYVTELSPDLADRLEHWVAPEDVFSAHRIDEQLAKGFDRKVWLPSGGTLIIDRTEAMTVIDVNTGRFTGAGATLEETVTRNNIEAAEEIVRQLRLRDIGGMIVIDFVDMVLESNRDLVLRRLVECLGRDRTRHQVTEVTSLGLVQMTRKRVGQGLVEAFSTTCECCGGRGFIVHDNPVENQEVDMSASASRSVTRSKRSSKKDDAAGSPSSRRSRSAQADSHESQPSEESRDEATRAAVRGALAQIAAAAEQAHNQAASEAAGDVESDASTQATLTASDGTVGSAPDRTADADQDQSPSQGETEDTPAQD